MKFWNVVYNWADAGYVLSKGKPLHKSKKTADKKPQICFHLGTMNALMNMFPSDKDCDHAGRNWKNSDWYLGKYLAELNIRPVDTRDHIGRSRFIGHSLKRLLFPGGVSIFERYWRDSLYLSPDCPQCCSNFAITYNLTTSTTRKFQFNNLYYHLRSFSGGGHFGNQKMAPPTKFGLNNALTLDEKLKEEALEKLLMKKLKEDDA